MAQVQAQSESRNPTRWRVAGPPLGSDHQVSAVRGSLGRACRVGFVVLLALFGSACSGQGPNGDPPPKGPGEQPPQTDHRSEPVHDVIAYASADGDSIRLIAPDGDGDRLLWAHGQDDPSHAYDVWNMSWNETATELAFVSTHENWCSLFLSDVFTIGADGKGYRRVTQAPSCAELARYPQGTVRVPIRNDSYDSFAGFLYFQGAESLQAANLPPLSTGMVTFENVADFGSGDDGLQVGAVIYGSDRELAFTAIGDVIADGAITTPETSLYPPASTWEVRSPAWSADGARIGHLLNFDGLWQLPRNPGPLAFGDSLLAEDVRPDGYVALLAWGPTAATADQLLYAQSFGDTGVYFTVEGSVTPGAPLVTFESWEAVLGLAWLPDGSGFVYSVTEGDYFGEDRSSNLYHYDLDTDQITKLTDLVGEFVGQVSVSGSGDSFVFEVAAELDEFGADLLDPDLWVIDSVGVAPRLLVEGASAPAWSH